MIFDEGVEILLPSAKGNDVRAIGNDLLSQGKTNARGGTNHENRLV